MKFQYNEEKLNRWWRVQEVYKQYRMPHQSKREIARRARQIDKGMLHADRPG